MENPARDIEQVVRLLTTAITPDIQKDAVKKFFTHDAGFRHPIVYVPPGPQSRESILGIFQWYRIISPHIDITVQNISYDADKKTLFLDLTQKFHLWWSPFSPAPARLLTRLTLRKENDLHYIALQEDFYHTDDFMALLVPPLCIPIRLALRTGAVVSNLAARTTQVLFTTWLPKSGVLADKNDTH
ncbi:hypothetical protein BV25DRAFT_1880829 [Artomyces pyxidatus]|uniref:Uncharacterized protein n=1 Tax=Artomyces pyxidatus TaxID=48021 RepID=A0ACB8T9G1_9AGAM|nr:hypothetical protein BV25DRAFT_1880829 [Artomyces pyxidatus]